jgi:hypothetical protein
MRARLVIRILRDLPFFDHETTAIVPTGNVIVRPFQIVVWVSITPQHVIEYDAATPRVPAVLDTGNNHNFSLREEHLLKWAGATRESHLTAGGSALRDNRSP